MRHLIFLGLLYPALAGSIHGQTILGLEMDDGNIYSIDSKNGQATQISSTSVNNHLWLWRALAKDGANGLFGGYGFLGPGRGTQIYKIEPSTGQCTLINEIPLRVVTALAFGPGNVLYALAEHTPGMGGTFLDLYTVDLAFNTVSLIGSTGNSNIDSLVYGFGALWTVSGTAGLLSVDPNTGIATDVNPGFLGPTDITESLCFSDHGVMYQVDTGLWIQDALTGVPALAGPLHFPGILGGIEYLPGPTSPFTLGTQGQTNGPMSVQVWGATPLGRIVILRSQGGGGPTFVPGGNPCAGTQIDLNASRAPITVLRADASGYAHFGPVIVPAGAAGTTRLQALDLTACATSNPARIIY